MSDDDDDNNHVMDSTSSAWRLNKSRSPVIENSPTDDVHATDDSDVNELPVVNSNFFQNITELESSSVSLSPQLPEAELNIGPRCIPTESPISSSITELESSSDSFSSDLCEAKLNTSPLCFPTESPIFSPVTNHYWGTTYRANDPCEDRFASLTNILLSPNNKTPSSERPSLTWNLSPLCNLSTNTTTVNQHRDIQQHPLFRISMFCVLDGHGGPIVAEYASKHLLPMLSTNIRQALDCTYVSMGEFRINNDIIAFKNDENEDILGEFEITDPWYTSPRDELCCPYHAALATITTHSTEESTGTEHPKKVEELSSTDSEVQVQIEHIKKNQETRNNSISSTILCEEFTDMPHRHEPLSVPYNLSEDILPPDKKLESSIEMEHIMSKTIRETFLQLDELWMNGIDLQKLRPACYMSNDKFNAGSCCLVTVIFQKSMYMIQGGKYIRCSSEAPCLYTSHLGDCRAILLSHPKDEDDPVEDEAVQDPFSDDDDSEDTEEQDADMSSCSSNESNDSFQEERVQTTRNRMIPFKKRRLPVKRSIWVQRPPSIPSFNLNCFALTRDHTPYNKNEEILVRQRCRNAPNAIAPAISGGIKRVAGSLSVTRALGDAYLKCKQISFFPFKDHAPYITACPEISMREMDDRAMFLVLGTDGVWEKVDGTKIAKWVSKYFSKISDDNQSENGDGECQSIEHMSVCSTRKRKWNAFSPLSTHTIASRTNALTKSNISDVITWKILNKVRRTRKMKSLKALMAFPPGRARRLRHDDITACVIDLSGFVDFVDYQT